MADVKYWRQKMNKMNRLNVELKDLMESMRCDEFDNDLFSRLDEVICDFNQIKFEFEKAR